MMSSSLSASAGAAVAVPASRPVTRTEAFMSTLPVVLDESLWLSTIPIHQPANQTKIQNVYSHPSIAAMRVANRQAVPRTAQAASNPAPDRRKLRGSPAIAAMCAAGPANRRREREMSERHHRPDHRRADRRVEAILRRAGLNAAQAGALARVIVAGERDACKSHGIYRIEGILRTVKAGKVNPQAVPELHAAGRLRHRQGRTRAPASPMRRWSSAPPCWPSGRGGWASPRWSSTTARISPRSGPRSSC